MAYQDLYADAAIFYNLNNNFNPVINTTVAPDAAILDGLSGTGETRVYYNEAPPGSPYTHSLRLNAQSNPPRTKRLKVGTVQGYTNNYGFQSIGTTINFWYKVVTTTDPVNIGGTVTFFGRENVTISDERASISSGTNYFDASGLVGKLGWSNHRYVTNASAVSTLTNANGATPGITPNQWYNITYTWLNHRVAGSGNGQYNLERAIYINGSLAHNTFQASTNGFDPQDDLEFFYTGTSSTNAQIMSSLALWNRPLSREEIVALAFNNNVITDINTYNNAVVNDSGAVYYVTLNNPDKNTDTDVYGTKANWGALNDSPSSIEVNQESKFGKSWKLTTNNGSTVQEVDLSSGATMNSEMSTALAADNFGGWSIELWVKSPTPSPVSDRRINTLYGASYSSNRIDLGIRTIATGGPATMWAAVPRWVSGNTFLAQNMNGAANYGTSQNAKLTYTTSSQLKELYRHLPLGISDGEWHHLVLTYRIDASGSDQGGSLPGVRVYVDGLLQNHLALPTTSGINQLTAPFLNVFFGHPSSDQAIAPDTFIDKYAVYSRRLTINEINKHWVIGKAFINQNQNAVKYYDGTDWQTASAQKVWNGTEWIDWDHKYWNGTAWIDL
jgi:hypothetical protein